MEYKRRILNAFSLVLKREKNIEEKPNDVEIEDISDTEEQADISGIWLILIGRLMIVSSN